MLCILLKFQQRTFFYIECPIFNGKNIEIAKKTEKHFLPLPKKLSAGNV